MEIKSIKQIKQIGNFINISCPSCRFEKLTLIYGLNAFGKTTLCDIFQSLKENNSEIIIKRKTIPLTSSQQAIEISVKIDGIENSVKFNNNNWEQNELRNYLEIFGTDFIYRNVFTGLKIERQNKENFTDFILGEEDVIKAEELKVINHNLRLKKNDLKNSVPSFVENKSEIEIEKFIDLDITENINELRNVISKKESELFDEKKKLDNSSQIISKEELPEFERSNITELIKCIRFLNTLLLWNFESIKESSLLKLNEHIEINFSNKEEAETWLEKGLKISNIKNENDNCPFCGQDLEKVRNLIELYQSLFNKEYSEYIEKLESNYQSSIKNIRNFKIAYSENLTHILLIIKGYANLINEKNFQDNIETFKQIKSSISELQNNIGTELKSVLEEFEVLFEAKMKKPHIKSPIVDHTFLINLIEEIVKQENQIEQLNNEFVKSIQYFKEQYRTNDKAEFVRILEKEIESVNIKLKRIEQDSDCKNYRILKKEIEELQNRREQIDKEIEESQSSYLDKYFSGINNLFKQLGSNDFTLIKKTDNRGNKKVYSLEVKYKNQSISSDQLPSVFSESDRRALALAIFWTKLDVTDKEDLENTILILDDPVTSFDDNRITKTVNIMKSMLSKVSQVIVLTHYTYFIKRFLEITKKNQIYYKLFELKKESLTSTISSLDENEFTLDDHEKNFYFIYNFINRKHQNNIKSDLRNYLHNQLKRIFYKQIIELDLNVSELNVFIDNLFENNIIREEQKEKLHEFRRTTNADSHIFTSNNDEDVRNFAKEMIEYLHNLQFSDKIRS
ncbi:MAG: AAA family ATPase [Ignavibacteriales bacterium]|nr:AAA family ATPase [Ignavibacteriales bacterium]